MKKLTLSVAAVMAMSTFSMAGGDIAPVEPVVETPVVVEAASDAGFYIGLGYSFVESNMDIDFTWNALPVNNANADTSAVMFQAGYKFNDYIAVEGRYWYGIGDLSFDHTTLSSLGDNTDMTAWGIYVKPMYPVTDALDVYALLGYAEAEIDNADFKAAGISGEHDGLSWGVGAAYSFTDNIAVFADYVAFTEDTISNAVHGDYKHDFDTINFGLTYKF